MSFDAIRFALIFAAARDYELHTIDIKTAYLNAYLEDESSTSGIVVSYRIDIWTMSEGPQSSYTQR